jgi:hypothetical protein
MNGYRLFVDIANRLANIALYRDELNRFTIKPGKRQSATPDATRIEPEDMILIGHETFGCPMTIDNACFISPSQPFVCKPWFLSR